MPVTLVAVPRVATPHIRRGRVRLGVLGDTEAARGLGGDVQACGARRGGIARIVGEPDCALLRSRYGLESRASGVRGENGRG